MARARTLAVAISVALSAALPAAAVAAPGWSKLSGDTVSPLDAATLLGQGGRVLAAWPSGAGTGLATGIDFRGFAPTASNSLAGAGPIAPAASGFNVVSDHPALFAGAGGPRVAFAADTPDGKSLLYQSGPLAEGASPGAPAVLGDTITGTLDAVGAADGTPIIANDQAGSLTSQRGALVAPATGFPIQAQLGGCCSYYPATVTDAAGGVWVAWYSNATNQVGIYVQALDPATGAPVGAPARAPQSETVSDNTQRIALVANPGGPGVRLVYGAEAGAGRLRIVSWSPGEGAPVAVAVPSSTGLSLFVSASRRADGRLWVAWYDNGTSAATSGYYAKLGDARGAGGTAVALRQPPGTTRAGSLTTAAVGNDLLVVPVVQHRPRPGRGVGGRDPAGGDPQPAHHPQRPGHRGGAQGRLDRRAQARQVRQRERHRQGALPRARVHLLGHQEHPHLRPGAGELRQGRQQDRLRQGALPGPHLRRPHPGQDRGGRQAGGERQEGREAGDGHHPRLQVLQVSGAG